MSVTATTSRAVDQPAARTWSIRFGFREDATGPYGVAL